MGEAGVIIGAGKIALQARQFGFIFSNQILGFGYVLAPVFNQVADKKARWI